MFREHADHPSAIYGKAIPLVHEEFTKNYLTSTWLKTDDSIFNWLVETIHGIKEGNYDVILPRDLGTIKHGAAPIHKDDFDSRLQWTIIDGATNSDYLTDDNRRDYAIHVILPTFIENLIHSCFTAVITPAQLDSITPTKMNALKAIVNDLHEIARQNADPTIPFENRLDGNRDLHTPYIPLA